MPVVIVLRVSLSILMLDRCTVHFWPETRSGLLGKALVSFALGFENFLDARLPPSWKGEPKCNRQCLKRNLSPDGNTGGDERKEETSNLVQEETGEQSCEREGGRKREQKRKPTK